MKRSLARIFVGLVTVGAVLLVNPITKSKPQVFAQPSSSAPHCRHVGGTVMTDFGAIDATTTMGTATGDLRGAVSWSILGVPQTGPGGTVIFHVQHHWVTESGDELFFDPATATTMSLGSGLFAVLTSRGQKTRTA